MANSNLCTNCKQPKRAWIMEGCKVSPSGERVPYRYCSVTCVREAKRKATAEQESAA